VYEDLGGSVDDVGQPMVRIKVLNYSDSVIAFIDTGFNGALLIDETQAQRMGLSIAPPRVTEQVRLASQRNERFLVARGDFLWFGERRKVTALVMAEPAQARSARRLRTVEEEILIGTELLKDCRLEIDFPKRTVRITMT
jgi:predicted aspartyl protease